MINYEEEWVPVVHPLVMENMYQVSIYGQLKDSMVGVHEDEYHSTNGYDFSLFRLKDGTLRLIPIDEIVALSFGLGKLYDVNIPTKVEHIDGNLRNNYVDNLRIVPDIEIWKPVIYENITPGYYEVSNFGNIKSLLFDKIMQTSKGHGNYRILEMSAIDSYGNKYGRSIVVHRVVATVFIEKTDEKMWQVNHIDGIPYHNHLKNLEWVTPSMNVLHALRTGLATTNCGEDVPTSLLTNDQVRKICELIVKYSGDNKSIMKECHDIPMSMAVLTSIKLGASWTSISKDYFEPGEFSRKMPESLIHEICKLLLKHDGDIYKVQLDLEKEGYEPISYRKIQDIRLCNDWHHITSQYFTKERFLNHQGKRGIIARGENAGPSEMSNSDAEFICKLLIEHFGNAEWVYRDCQSLGKSNITLRMITHIKNKECWNHISDKYFTKEEISGMSTQKIKLICEALVSCDMNIDKAYELCKPKMKYLIPRFVNDIKCKYTYTNISNEYF